MITTVSANNSEPLQKSLRDFFIGWDLTDSKIFRDGIAGFLFFNYENLTEPHLFHSFLGHGNSPIYVGYLSRFIGPVRDDLLGALYVPQDAGLDEITDAFTRDPGLPEEAAIQYFVRSGFVVPSINVGWSIWFSTYWEIAICGFRSVQDAREFRSIQTNLVFLDNEDVISQYSTNPASKAPICLASHLRLNLI